jgi:cobaltochelatase CobS
MSAIESLTLAGYSTDQIADILVRRASQKRADRDRELAEQERLKMEAIAKARSEAPKTTAAAVTLPDGKRGHYLLPLLIAAMKAGVNAALVGPAGSGKTTAAAMAAEALGKGFEAVSFGPTTSKSDLFGMRDANGKYHDTGLVRSARDGKVFLGDELDAGHPGIITGINMVLANEHFSTVDGMLTKHAAFCAIFGMNTFGRGRDRKYVGRNQLDAASLDRLFVIEWNYDEGLEAWLAGVTDYPSPSFDVTEGGTMGKADWFRRVIAVRRAVEALGLEIIVSPRATENGNKLFAAGVGRTHVEAGIFWRGMDSATRTKIESWIISNPEVAR